MWSIVHHKKGDAVHDVVFEDTHNGGMSEMGDGTRFLEKAEFMIVGQAHLEYLDGGFSVEVDMLAEVDVSEAALSEQAHQAVVCELLTYPVWHGCISPWA